MRRLAAVMAGALLAACTPGSTAPSTIPPSSTVPPSTTAPPSTAPGTAGEPAPATDCRAPARDLVILCEAYDLVADHHVDPADPSELAAAALLGLAELERQDRSPSVEMPPCPAPDDELLPVCGAIAEAVAAGVPPRTAAEAAVEGMFRYGLDPFSSYVPKEEAGDAVLDPGSVPELGLSVAIVGPDGSPCATIGGGCTLRVTAVFPFSGAETAGIVPGDEIASVGGVPVDGWTLDDVGSALTVPAGAEVVIQVVRPGSTLSKAVTADDLSAQPGAFELLGPGIAYLRLRDFSQDAARLAGAVFALPAVESARAFVLDLRGNPGGLLRSAQAVTSQFLRGGTAFVEQTRDGERRWPVLEGGLAGEDLEVVVLVDGGTASAAEMVSAALQEAGRAVVVGVPTFGKHLVQQLFDGRDGGRFRVTVSRWTTAEGASVAFSGLVPDVVVDSAPSSGGDPVLDRAIELLGG